MELYFNGWLLVELYLGAGSGDDQIEFLEKVRSLVGALLRVRHHLNLDYQSSKETVAPDTDFGLVRTYRQCSGPKFIMTDRDPYLKNQDSRIRIF